MASIDLASPVSHSDPIWREHGHLSQSRLIEMHSLSIEMRSSQRTQYLQKLEGPRPQGKIGNVYDGVCPSRPFCLVLFLFMFAEVLYCYLDGAFVRWLYVCFLRRSYLRQSVIVCSYRDNESVVLVGRGPTWATITHHSRSFWVQNVVTTSY